MSRFIAIIMLVAALTASASTSESSPLQYKVQYKWGFIQKTAGSGTVQFKLSGDTINATLSGHSIPWSGRQYTVNDTLRAVVTPSAETVLYINGRYTKPTVTENPDGSVTVNPVEAYKNIHGQGTLNASPQTMEAITITAQMLAMYYYASALPLDSWQTGQKATIPITMPSGPAENVTITYQGRQEAASPAGPVNAYDITFTYTYHGQPSNYNVTCLIDPDTRVPLMIAADLEIGHLEMVLEK